jgi:hypothetical protein
MTMKSKLAVIAAVAAMSVASPALAQSFNLGDGAGNVLPFSYGPGGAKARWTVAPQNNQIAVPQIGSGLYNYAGPQSKQADTHRR